MVRGKLIREHFIGEQKQGSQKRKDVSYHFEKIGDYYIWDVSDTGNVGEIGGVVTAIYLKERILESELWFPEHVAYEDNYWGTILKLYIRNLYILDEVVYHYYINMHSTVTSRNMLYQLDRLKIEVDIVEKYKELGLFEFFYGMLERNFIKRYYLNTLFILFTRFDDIPDIFGDMKEKVFEYFPDYKKHLCMSDYTEREKILLELLEIPDVSLQDLRNIQKVYNGKR